jgi:hypothetical protein
MDGWMDGRMMDGWMDGWTDDGWMDGWMNICVSYRKDIKLCIYNIGCYGNCIYSMLVYIIIGLFHSFSNKHITDYLTLHNLSLENFVMKQ